jgi:hypothetical protein
LTENDEIYVYGNIRTASNIRIHCHDEWNVISMDTLFVLPKNNDHFLVFDKRDENKLDLNSYEIFSGSEEWLRVPVFKFPGFLKHPIEDIKNSGTMYLIAKPRQN